jgi:hypothetical protein
MPLGIDKTAAFQAAVATLNEATGATRPRSTAFKPTAARHVESFARVADALASAVKKGQMTLLVAREAAAAHAASARDALTSDAVASLPPRGPLAQSLDSAYQARKGVKKDVHEENHRLLSELLVETRIGNLSRDLTVATSTRVKPGARLIADPVKLVALIRAADESGNEAESEWGRRALEKTRPLLTDEKQVDALELAVSRRDTVSPAALAVWVKRLTAPLPADSPDPKIAKEAKENREALARALESSDASCLAACYAFHREGADEAIRTFHDSGGQGPPPLALQIVKSMERMPLSALATLTELEEARRAQELKDAAAVSQEAQAKIGEMSQLSWVKQPTDSELVSAAYQENRNAKNPMLANFRQN